MQSTGPGRVPRRRSLRLRRVRSPGGELQELLAAAIPADHARQTLAEHLIERRVGAPAAGSWRVLDLGCGTGGSIDVFRTYDPGVD